MKIIYKSSDGAQGFKNLGVENCIIKQISCDADRRFTMKKEHHHTGFEVHMITKGCQNYVFSGFEEKIEAGKTIIISPLTKHSTGNHTPGTEKISIMFSADMKSPFASFSECGSSVKIFDTDSRMAQTAEVLCEERKNRFLCSPELSDALATEIMVRLMRLSGCKDFGLDADDSDEDVRVQMAKQYITDNIEQNLKVSDVASYCYMGEKQLTRLFKLYVGETPGACIHKQKCARIEELLTQNISLKEISEKMNFTSEYHFNSFFKKYAGMPPGEFRKMVAKNK